MAPAMHLRSLAEFEFASVLCPYNHTMMADERYAAEFESLARTCRERDVALQTIKSVARRRWNGSEGPKFSWYEPLTDPDAISRAVRFVLARPQLFLNTTSDARLLPAIVAAAQVDRPDEAIEGPDEATLRADVDTFGITPLFDGAELERI